MCLLFIKFVKCTYTHRVARPFGVAAKQAGTVRLVSWVRMHRTQHKNTTQLQTERDKFDSEIEK